MNARNQEDEPMTTRFSGGCACGAIRYECTAEPVRVYHCHCTDCHKATGSAFHTGLLMSRQDVTFSGVEPKTWDRPTDSGNVVTEAFCGTCGSPIYVCSTARTTHMPIKAGSLDDPKSVRAGTQIWTRSAVPWHDTCLATEHHEAGVPPAEKS
jgi:hypothetical protein